MTIVISNLVSADLGRSIRKQISYGPAFSAMAIFLALLIIPKMFMLGFDERLHNGVNIWIKPIKFDIALSIYLATLAVFARWIPQTTRNARWFKAFNALIILSVFYEIIWINGAAAAGISSHFNIASPLMGLAYTLAGLFSLILISAALIYGILIFRNKTTGLSKPMHFAIWFGSIATFVLTLITANYMAAQTGHLVGGNALDTEAYPIMGWATDGGDLRIAHFFASHILHALPLFVLAASLFLSQVPRTAVAGFAALYTAFTFYTLWEAMNGTPFLGTFQKTFFG